MNENGDEFIWSEGPFSSTKHRPLLNNMLHKIETYSLLCPSCHEFYENAVTLRPCHHSFCSKCIRRHLCVRNGVKHQRCCPVCNSKIEIRKMNGQSKKLDDDDAIIPNHGLQVRSAEDWYQWSTLILSDWHFIIWLNCKHNNYCRKRWTNTNKCVRRSLILFLNYKH